MQQRYIISAIYEKDAKTPKESDQFRIGRTGTISFLCKGASMCFEYDSEDNIGTFLKTSWVEMFNETEEDMCVYTENSVYILEKI
jgi:hypothetical protein